MFEVYYCSVFLVCNLLVINIIYCVIQKEQSLTKLTYLHVSWNKFASAAEQISELDSLVLPAMKQLHLNYCHLHSAFFTNLKLEMPKLEYLSIKETAFSQESTEGMTNQCFPSLKKLDLSYCSFTPGQFEHLLSKGAAMCPRLEMLLLEGITDLKVPGMRALGRNPWKLKHLDLSRCGLAKDEIKAFAEGQNVEWLEELDLTWNSKLDMAALFLLVSLGRFKCLKRIKLVSTGVGTCQAEKAEAEILQTLDRMYRRPGGGSRGT